MTRILHPSDEATTADVRRELDAGNRVLLLVRHSERPRIDNEDTTFGESLPLTANGSRMAVAFGEMLRGASDDVSFRASPLRRTVLTAERVAEGMGLAGAEVVRDARIGNGSAFVESARRLWELFRDGSFFEKMEEYMARGVQYGFNPLGPATDAFEEYALSVFTSRLGVFVTHDLYIAAFLHARGVKTDFCFENWPCFLDSAAIVVEPTGRVRHALVRAGLSDLVCGVATEE